jgi:hypothetical protein
MTIHRVQVAAPTGVEIRQPRASACSARHTTRLPQMPVLHKVCRHAYVEVPARERGVLRIAEVIMVSYLNIVSQDVRAGP